MKTIADAVRDFKKDPIVAEGLRLVERLPEPPPRDEVGEKRDEAAAERAAEDERKKKRLHELTEIWGVPFADAQQITTGVLVETPALEAVRKLRKHATYGAILCLSGPNGCGKSLASSWLVVQGPPRDYPFGGPWPREHHPRYISVGDLQRVSLFGDDAEWRKIKAASVLAIDDVGTEFKDDKGAFAARFDQLIAHREKAPCWTVMTTNLTMRPRKQGDDSFSGKYGERVLDRLRRHGSAFLHLKNESLRPPSDHKKTTHDPNAKDR